MYTSFQEHHCVWISIHNSFNWKEKLEWDGIISYKKENWYTYTVLDGAFEFEKHGVIDVTESIRFRVSEAIPSTTSLSTLLLCENLETQGTRWWNHFATRIHLLSHFEIGLSEDDIQKYLLLFKKTELNDADIEFLRYIQDRAKLHLQELKEKTLQKRNNVLWVGWDLTLF